MNMETFSAKEIFSFGWMKAKKFLVLFCGLFLIIFAVNLLLAFFKNTPSRTNESMFLIYALSCFVDLVVGLGLIKVALDICDDKTPGYAVFFYNFDIFLNYTVGFILFSLLTTLGILILVIPGIVWFLKFQFFGYFIVDKKLGPIEALKESARITHGIKLRLIKFAILVGFINFLGALVLGIGLIVSIPTTIIAHAALYRKLASKSIKTGDASAISS
ncbi:MAG: hypothetical protein L6416_11410 [Candidatus Omnitrophica bacterium]|nr:hypothetical protein [Candidatus Omnitrophota bacterium]